MTRLKDIGAELEKVAERKVGKHIRKRKLKDKHLKELGHVVVNEIKSNVSKGISPIQGRGRFPAYKNPENYPDKIRKKYPSKRRRPVNLKLSGDFLRSLRYVTQKNPSRLRIGFTGRKSQIKERGHRDGANGQPRRPIIPVRNEQFSKRILLKLRQSYIKIVKKLFDR